ncbi:MAG: glycosyltransferase, partial [Desulfobacteraceae bacterium]|nr:glycosyltransferase [Desulfobacteraceae bacterium]
MSEFLFWISITALFYVYFGYYLTLKLLYAFIQPTNTLIKKTAAPVFPQVSVVIAAFNEEKNIAARIKNLLEQDYPGQMEIIVASDGSNDNTVSISSQFKKFGVKVLDFKENRGRAKVHNDAIEDAAGDIVVTTDAETIFEKNFITQITAPFQDSRVGCTVGRLYFWDKKSGIAKAEGLYWKWEVRTRILQDKLGVLMTGTGACTAFRKILF